MTLADIGKLAGVSASTVSRALADSPLITDDVKSRIKAIAEQHNFQIHRGARNLRLQRTGMVAVVIPFEATDDETLSNPFVLEFLGAVGLELRHHNYNMILLRERVVNEQLLHSGIADGFVQLGHGFDPNYLNTTISDVPFVVWGQALPNQTYVTVGIDNRHYSKEAVDHLIQQGRRRIGIVVGQFGQQNTESYFRFAGYQDALQSAGIPYNPNWLTFSEYNPTSGRGATLQLLEQAPDVDAIFVGHSDMVALVTIETLRQSGREVPADVAVIGFDNISLGEYLNIPLTTVSQEIKLQGARILIETLVKMIAGHAVSNVQTQGKVVIRKSSGG